jgi:hypothetical protein
VASLLRAGLKRVVVFMAEELNLSVRRPFACTQCDVLLLQPLFMSRRWSGGQRRTSVVVTKPWNDCEPYVSVNRKNLSEKRLRHSRNV